MYHSVASGASYEGVYYLSIHENGLVEINDVIVSIDAPLQIAGYCTYLGTTELGMVYQFGLYSGDQLREGAFALDLYNTDYGEMTITPISGVNLFDAPGGGYTIFSPAVIPSRLTWYFQKECCGSNEPQHSFICSVCVRPDSSLSGVVSLPAA